MFGFTEAVMILLAFLFYIVLIGGVVWFAIRLLKAIESIARNVQRIADKGDKLTS